MRWANEVLDMSDLEKLVRRRMQEEYAKGASAERIEQLVREIFNSIDLSQTGDRDAFVPNRTS